MSAQKINVKPESLAEAVKFFDAFNIPIYTITDDRAGSGDWVFLLQADESLSAMFKIFSAHGVS